MDAADDARRGAAEQVRAPADWTERRVGAVADARLAYDAARGDRGGANEA
ncbi:hypothetical protein [Streptomyces sp. VRA16 Mangrove soil]|nr:hypothetical protein [Streptomyces sp. VRA16 Mangrove soil]MBO1334939.1 hypothetical protein [Streptomyces sp. VRA16 Mangrove soil]